MDSKFPERLRRLREKKGVRRYIIAELCGVTRWTVKRWEDGETEPLNRNLKEIADYFDVSTDYLLGRTDNPFTNW